MLPVADKYADLVRRLQQLAPVAVAFSGGVDSTLLLRVARDVLGADRVLALTAVSPLLPRHELERSQQLARILGVRQLLLETPDLNLPDIFSNQQRRCYFCKKAILTSFLAKTEELGFANLVDGSNSDDLNDFRPGRAAANELGIHSPLTDAGFNKAEIRQLSRHLDLPTWDLPSFACLASRIPYGTAITRERLAQIEHCESHLRQLDFRLYRVRYHGNLARIELAPEELARLLEPGLRENIIHVFKTAGFNYVTLDLQGYRTGSMNETS
ncbi:MAG: ATP-dependent sacrificial sulfur transferase LarE [Desulfuromonadaceae bacterium]